MDLDKIGGRKFIFAMLSLIFSFVFVLANKLTVDAWTQFTFAIGSMYAAGNIAEHLTNKP